MLEALCTFSPISYSKCSLSDSRITNNLNQLSFKITTDDALVSSSNKTQASTKAITLEESTSRLLTPDAHGNLNEEELQYAIVAHLLGEDDKNAADKFCSAFNSIVLETHSFEDAVKLSLKKVVAAGLVSQEQAEQINGWSFRAAQLDQDLDTLFDNRGEGADTTIAVMPFDQAVEKAESCLKLLQSGDMAVKDRSLDAQSNTVSVSSSGTSKSPSHGGAGFLWKPVSDSNGKLVVLFPASLTGNIISAGLYSSLPPTSENMIENGRFSGDSHNGRRAHFRFSKPGEGYSNGVYVVAHLKNGQIASYRINSTGRRYES
jgi:hypothetical protein